MKIIWCCFVAALLTVSRGAVDVEKTVQQVQSILQANKLLPRLTRDEILQLLNDIRAEDAKSVSSNESQEDTKDKSTTPYSTVENEIISVTQTPNIEDNTVADVKYEGVSTTSRINTVETTTNKNEPKLMVVLPYTPRDGSSLQELYTRPPRVEVVNAPSITPKPDLSKLNLEDILKQNKNPMKDIVPEELIAFLDAHGLNGNPGQDHFLLPLEGFKPLPPPKIIDGTVQLPENILLSYDLISSNTDSKSSGDGTFLYEPLRPEIPFELETASSEKKEVRYPYDMPKRDISKNTPNYDPIDYDSVKVIPLKKNINPLDEVINKNSEQSKRQASSEALTEKTETTTSTESPKTNVPPTSDTVPADSDTAPADSDTGASIADLEDSFGGAAPSQPGDSQLPPPKKNGFYWMLDWNSFLEVGDGDTKVNIRFEPKLGDPQMFLPVTVP